MCWAKACERLATCMFHGHVLWKHCREPRQHCRPKPLPVALADQPETVASKAHPLIPSPESPKRSVSWARSTKNGSGRRTKRKNGRHYQKPDPGPDEGSGSDDADCETDSPPSRDETTTSRIRCVVVGVDGGPNRVVWLDVGLGGPS